MSGRHRRYSIPQRSEADKQDIVRLQEQLSDPSEAWRDYLRQEPWDRFSQHQLASLATRMERGGDHRSKFCAAVAYAEAAMISGSGPNHDFFALASRLAKLAVSLTPSGRDGIRYTIFQFALPLYRLPGSVNKISDSQLDEVLLGVRKSLDEIASVLRVTIEAGASEEEPGSLRGSLTDIYVLRALQRPDLIRSGLMALPAAPWESHSIRKNDVYYSNVGNNRGFLAMPIEENRNYDISVVSVVDPRQIIPVQVESASNPKLRDTRIRSVSAEVLARDVCRELGLQPYSFRGLMEDCTDKEREDRYELLGDFFMDEILDID
jgi:hypothetical protein